MTTSETRILGTLRRLEGGKGAVRMEDVYDTDVDDLWSALTEPDRLVRWIATVDGDLRAGGHLHARFTSSWEGTVRVDVCDRPRHLAVTLAPGAEDQTVVEATLRPEDGKTRLVVEERGLLFEELAGHGAGWQSHVEDLALHIEEQPASDWRTRWMALTPTYREILDEVD
jgi:uncharacterized protein YndB with AHSA1/START domain